MNTKIILTIITLALSQIGLAQKFKTPVDYMEYMDSQYEDITKEMWDYTAAASHGKRAKKVEKKRQELVKTIAAARNKINTMPEYETSGALRDSVVAYLKLSYHIMNFDYAKIVDMEEVAEQSYDQMEAYIKAKEMASDKMDRSSQRLEQAQKIFASTYGITLLESKTELSKKMEVAGEVYKYYNDVYLIFFKAYKQEFYLLEAVNNKDVSGIEQNRSSLKSAAEEGLSKLKAMKSFKGDKSMLYACTKLFNFYIDEADNAVPVITDYYIKQENFEKIKDAFESKKESKRTQQDVDQYNQAVNDINEASQKYNAVNNSSNEERSKLTDAYNNACDKFIDRFVPKK